MSTDPNTAVTPLLETRHVFLDTQVYNGLKHNPHNPALRALAQHVMQGRLTLHVTDVTLEEVARQLREVVAARARELAAIEKDLARWRHATPKAVPRSSAPLDTAALALGLSEALARAILTDCRAELHRAMEVSPKAVFDAYFRRDPPFDGKGGKEFPDAFALHALEAWCAAKGERMYVVTEDQAMLRAAAASTRFLALKNIQSVLTLAAADGEAQALAHALMAQPSFERELKRGLKGAISDAIFIYTGELAQGEAFEGDFVDLIAVRDWELIGRSKDAISLSLEIGAIARVEVQFEDRSEAVYDREDDRWYGIASGSTEVETEVELPVFVELDTLSGRIKELRVLDREVEVAERYESYK
ncbi:PIN domain-containing protein [Phenylobacterium sp.]|jgi:predicted nucleic acid-binding protein|uniref:PIN domain-containing protein n=1 Tax=Phenylobacterium sp. TaxID=1871053 RepID=UPI0035AFAAE2